MQTIHLHRSHHVTGTIAAVVLALLLIGTPTGRNMLAWIYLQSSHVVTDVTHIHQFPLDRLAPTFPQCI